MVKAKSSKAAVSSSTRQWSDAKNALLVVSLFINAFILVGWMVLKLTNQYDATLVTTLLAR